MKRLLIGGTVVTLAATSLAASGSLASIEKAPPKVEASTVTVTAGKPVEYGFTLSTLAVRPGPIAFKVTNKGKLQYSFEICSAPGSADVCFGESTPALDPGKSVTLSVRLPKGKYEFIGTADSYVTEKGNITVTSTAAATPKTKVATGTATKPKGTTQPNAGGGKGTTPGGTTTTTTPPPGAGAGAGVPPGTIVGDPVAGAGLFQQAGCGSCHTLKAAGTTGTVGPNLDEVAPDEQTVITNVTYGNAMGMPAFSPQFSTAQIQDIAAYVYKSTH